MSENRKKEAFISKVVHLLMFDNQEFVTWGQDGALFKDPKDGSFQAVTTDEAVIKDMLEEPKEEETND